MSSIWNPEVTSPPADAADRRAARLAEIKRLAAAAVRTAEAASINDEDLYDTAASALSARRAERGDLVGALIWEQIARHEHQAGPSSVDADRPNGDDQSVPAHRISPDQPDGV